jgi:hypothetical protein
MAQDTVQGTGQVQTYILRRPYRETGYGGFTKSYVLTPSGQFIKPSVKRRSRTGNHGEDEWLLGTGRYVVIDVNRPNIKNGPKPYSITIQCVEVNSELKTITSRTMYVMDYELSDLREWALSICP